MGETREPNEISLEDARAKCDELEQTILNGDYSYAYRTGRAYMRARQEHLLALRNEAPQKDEEKAITLVPVNTSFRSRMSVLHRSDEEDELLQDGSVLGVKKYFQFRAEVLEDIIKYREGKEGTKPADQEKRKKQADTFKDFASKIS